MLGFDVQRCDEDVAIASVDGDIEISDGNRLRSVDLCLLLEQLHALGKVEMVCTVTDSQYGLDDGFQENRNKILYAG